MENEVMTAVDALARLLAGSGATSRVNKGRVSRSIVYDLRYRTAVVSCAFLLHAKRAPGLSDLRLRADKLKFLQFVALRPWLISTVRQWSDDRGDAQRSMLNSDRLRRGFLSDTMHDRVIDYLVAARVFVRHRNGEHLSLGPMRDLADAVSAQVSGAGLFAAERAALVELQSIAITNDMLEGW
jgi:hypothetical protein